MTRRTRYIFFGFIGGVLICGFLYGLWVPASDAPFAPGSPSLTLGILLIVVIAVSGKMFLASRQKRQRK